MRLFGRIAFWTACNSGELGWADSMRTRGGFGRKPDGEKDRRGALDAIKTRTGIARAQTGVGQLFANVTGQLGTPSPQNILIQVLALPKIGETLEGFHRAIECHAMFDLPPAKVAGPPRVKPLAWRGSGAVSLTGESS